MKGVLRQLGRGLGMALFLAMLAVRPAWSADAVAMVTDVEGKATVSADGDSDTLRLLAYLQPGATIDLGNGARLVVTYFSKPREFVIAGPATLRIDADGPQVLKGRAAEAHSIGAGNNGTARKFSTLQRERLAQATFEMRASKPGIRLIGPVNTALLDVNPMLSWSGPGDAADYTVTLMDDGGKELRKITTAQANWRAADLAPLAWGHAYQWKVETTLRASGETLSAAGRFTVMDAQRAQEIAAARPPAGAEFSQRVLYAARLETEGLKYDARMEWQALARERPDDLVLQERAAR